LHSWDNLYARELANHVADPDDEGTVWFDESNAEAKMIAFLDAQWMSDGAVALGLDKKRTTFLDLGCGNGSMLLALRDDGWEGRMLGVDYSKGSIQLARNIARRRRAVELRPSGEGTTQDHESKIGAEAADDKVTAWDSALDFREWDMLKGRLEEVGVESEASGWDVLLDKGTFDAITLSAEGDEEGQRLWKVYRDRVLACLNMGGVLLITSCNWTEAELRGMMEGSDAESQDQGPARLRQVGKVQYKSFSFGGAAGQTICTLCFRKIS
jgi:EEF1A lysine methyltransferase 2